MYKKYKELLRQTGKFTYQICKEAGIPMSTMYMWIKRAKEDPGAKLSIEVTKKVADALGVSIEELI